MCICIYIYRVGHSYLSAAANHHFHPISVTCPIFHPLQLPEIFPRSCSSDISIDNSIILSRFSLSLCYKNSSFDEYDFSPTPNICICAYLFRIKSDCGVKFSFSSVYIYVCKCIRDKYRRFSVPRIYKNGDKRGEKSHSPIK